MQRDKSLGHTSASLKNLSAIAIQRFQSSEEPAPKRSRWDMVSKPTKHVRRHSPRISKTSEKACTTELSKSSNKTQGDSSVIGFRTMEGRKPTSLRTDKSESTFVKHTGSTEVIETRKAELETPAMSTAASVDKSKLSSLHRKESSSAAAFESAGRDLITENGDKSVKSSCSEVKLKSRNTSKKPSSLLASLRYKSPEKPSVTEPAAGENGLDKPVEPTKCSVGRTSTKPAVTVQPLAPISVPAVKENRLDITVKPTQTTQSVQGGVVSVDNSAGRKSPKKPRLKHTEPVQSFVYVPASRENELDKSAEPTKCSVGRKSTKPTVSVQPLASISVPAAKENRLDLTVKPTQTTQSVQGGVVSVDNSAGRRSPKKPRLKHTEPVQSFVYVPASAENELDKSAEPTKCTVGRKSTKPTVSVQPLASISVPAAKENRLDLTMKPTQTTQSVQGGVLTVTSDVKSRSSSKTIMDSSSAGVGAYARKSKELVENSGRKSSKEIVHLQKTTAVEDASVVKSKSSKSSSKRSEVKTSSSKHGPKKSSTSISRTLSPPKFNTSFKIPKKNLPNPLLESGPEKKTKKIPAPQSWLQKSEPKNSIPVRSALNTSLKPPNMGIDKLVLYRESCSEWRVDNSKYDKKMHQSSSYKKGNENSIGAKPRKSALLDVLEGRTEINLTEEIREAQLIRKTQLGLRPSKINSDVVNSKIPRKEKEKRRESVESTMKSGSTTHKRKRKKSGSSDEWTPRSRPRSRTKSKASQPHSSPPRTGVASRTRSRTRSPSAKAANKSGFSCRYSSDSESDEGEPSSTWSKRNIEDWMDQSTEEVSSPKVTATVPERASLEHVLRDHKRKKEIFVAREDNYISLEAIVSQRDTPPLNSSPSMPCLVAYGDTSPLGQSTEMPNLLTGSPSGALPQASSKETNLPFISGLSTNVPDSVPLSGNGGLTCSSAAPPADHIEQEEVLVLASPEFSDDLVIEDVESENAKLKEVEIIDLDYEGPVDFNLPFKELWARMNPRLKCQFEEAEDLINMSHNLIKNFISRFIETEKMRSKTLKEKQFLQLKKGFIRDFTTSWTSVESSFMVLHEDFSEKQIFTILRNKLATADDLSDLQGLVADMKHLNAFLNNPKMEKLTRNCGDNVNMVGKLFDLHSLKRDYAASSTKGVASLPRECQIGAVPVQRRASGNAADFMEEIPRTPSRDSGILGDTSPQQEDKTDRSSPQGGFKCSRCDKAATLKCSACDDIFYCSEGCQTAHWMEGHCSLCAIHYKAILTAS